ncbi:MAG TPA: OmpA family protein [Acidobacteriaceae bacterium]
MNKAPLYLLCMALATAAPSLLAQDAEGCKDSPLITRFPGSVLTSCKSMDDDVFDFMMDNGKPKTRVEGKFQEINYQFPKTASKAQVVRNMNTALRRAGYTMHYDSGDYGDFGGHMGKTWIQIEIGAGGGIRETIVEKTDVTQDVVATAAAMSSGLQSTGHTVVAGILFDTGKADVKPESSGALQEVVKLLEGNPKLKIYVVGHTDNVGAAAANLDHSRRRAASVVQVLETQYHVAADRLASFGCGPYSPVSSNDTEDGRSVNRRVELVQQ